MTNTTAPQALIDALDPDTLEAIANEIDDFENSARADSLRIIAKRQRAALSAAQGAPAEPDPHGTRYHCERAALALGHMSDDELANGAFMNYDQKLDIGRVLANEPDYHPPIVWMTAVKDRIRWLSRQLAAARASQPTPAQDAAATVLGSTVDEIFAAIDAAHEFGGPLHERIKKLIDERNTLKDAAATVPRADFEEMERRKDGAYEERNRVVAALAKCFPSGVARTAIEGWSEDWHGCVYIDLPTGQVSWHFHDSQAYLFEGLPPYAKPWDGHDTPEKYRRVAALSAPQAAPTAAQPLTTHPYEARRYCSGDGAWTDWQPCTSDQAAWWRQGHAGKFEIRDRVSAAAQAPALVPLTEHYKLDNDRQVFFYEQDFYVLSNFSSFALHWRGLDFPTSEHAYHWEKFNIDGAAQAECRKVFLTARSAHDAFKAAAELKQYRRADWDDVKVSIMRDILRAKAQQHEYVRRKLLETGDRELIEDSWRDDYWGWGPSRDGQNMLGKLWMEVRAGLRGITPAGTTPKEQQ